jgi:hypothetical protein
VADVTHDVDAAREVLIKSGLHDGSIAVEFERIGKGKVSFSTRQHTRTETQFVPLHKTLGPLT